MRYAAAALPALLACASPAPATPTAWSIDLGGALLYEPVYAGSRRSQTDPYPVLGFTYGTRLRGSLDDGLRWSAVKGGVVQAGPIVEYRWADRLRRALPTPAMRGAAEAGGFVQIDTPVAELEGRVRRAVNGYRGWSADLSADTGVSVGRFRLGAEARLAWADQRFVYLRYGAGTLGRMGRDGRINRPDYLTAGIEGDVGFRLTPRLTLGLLVSRDALISRFVSPARQQRRIAQAGTSLSIHFGTAPAR